MTLFSKMIKHFKLVMRHKYYVFMASVEAGIPFRGLLHDMSKFSPIEFFNSAKYYTGDRSPIDNEKDEKGYSYAWLHHRGHNPHHWEYWIDNLSSGGEALKMPSKYVKEMICDWIGSGKAYNKAEWTRSTPYDFFMNRLKKGQIKMHQNTEAVCVNILKDYKMYDDHITLSKILKYWINEYEKCNTKLLVNISMMDNDGNVTTIEQVNVAVPSAVNANRRVYDSETFYSTMKDIKEQLQNAAEKCMGVEESEKCMDVNEFEFDPSESPTLKACLEPSFAGDKLIDVSFDKCPSVHCGELILRSWDDLLNQINEIKSRGIDITKNMYNDIIHSKCYDECWHIVYEYEEGKRK